jgi:hypothetical protein
MKSLILETNEISEDSKQNAIKNYAINRLGVSAEHFIGDEDDDDLDESSIVGGTQVGKNDIQDTPDESAETTEEESEVTEGEESEKTDETTVTATESVNEEVEAEEVKETEDEPEVTEDNHDDELVDPVQSELQEMTKALATNILRIEKELGTKESVTINDVHEVITEKLEKNNQEVSQVMTAMATTIETLSKKVETLQNQLSKIVVNKPLVIHAPLENSQEKSKSRWA